MIRIESLINEGLSTIGRQALKVDVQDLLNELASLRHLSEDNIDERFDTLENKLCELERQLNKYHLGPAR